MVHALKEIHRTLAPNGLMVDLRPMGDSWPVEIVSDGEIHPCGRLTDLPAGISDDESANHAIRESARRGWFLREEEKFFPLFDYFDDPNEFENHLKEKWGDFIQAKESVIHTIRQEWEKTRTGKKLRVRMKMLLGLWRKR